jgi:nicotinic acid phosphoribosyltransferase
MLADMKTSALLTDLYQLTMLQGYFDQAHGRDRGFRVFCAQTAGAAQLL